MYLPWLSTVGRRLSLWKICKSGVDPLLESVPADLEVSSMGC